MFLTISLSNETKKIKAQNTDANGVNDGYTNRITENLARLADGLANISIKIERVESDLTYHSSSVAADMRNISIKIERVESSLAYHSNSVAGDMKNISVKIARVESDLAYHSNSVASKLAILSSRMEKFEVNLKEITVSNLKKPFFKGQFKKSHSRKKCQKRKLKTKKYPRG